MAEAGENSGPEPAGLLSRFVGIIIAPADTFKAVLAAPRWLDMLALTAMITAIFVGGFLATEVGREAWLEQALRAGRSLGGQVNEAQTDALKNIMPYVGVIAAVQSLIIAPLISLLVSGILFVVFSVILGATATFKQLFTVVVHAGVIGSVQQVFTWPLNYFREAMTSPSTLAVFLPMLDEEGFVFRFFNVIDLFLIWWIVVLSIGLAVLYKRRARPIALSLFAVYAAVALVVATFFGGS